MRSAIPYPQFIFFEEAKHPILSIEASLPQQVLACQNNRIQFAAAGLYPANYLPSSVTLGRSASTSTGGSCSGSSTSSNGDTTVVVTSVDLSNVSLLSGAYQTQLQLALASLQSQVGAANAGNVFLTATVCDDTNGNGECSDEKAVDILSVGSASFSLAHIPSTIQLDVWSGRGYSLSANPNMCEVQYSPLVMDLTGQGIKLTDPENGVYFDLNATGQELRTAWTGSNNVAFLVRNLGNGITSGADLFGTATRLSNGQLAGNGFEALKDLDSNNDNLFSPADKAWNQVQLWIDFNHDGVVQPGELSSLDKAGIQYIDLNYVNVMETDPYGNTTKERSTFHRLINGKSVPLLIIDVWFETLTNY